MLDPERPPAPDDWRPTLRNLHVERARQDDREGIAVRCPLGVARGQIFIPDGLLPVVSRFDGERTIRQIEAEIHPGAGVELPDDLVSGLAAQLDELLFLESDRFREALAAATSAFAALPARPSPHAGITAGYPDDPTALRDALGSMVRRPDADALRQTPKGLVAPHIDLARGREGYAMAYSALAECEPADLYVVFGTGHQGPSAPVTGLPMDWQTPLGTVRTDRDFVAAIHRHLGPADPADLMLHRDEHSLEFQMLFLQHVLGDRKFAVAGFLTGPLLGNGGPTGPVEDDPSVRSILEGFQTVCDRVRGEGRRVCFVAGADLAHIGPFFGDPAPVDAARLERLTNDELLRLKHLEDGNPARFFAAIEAAGNPDRVCGTTPMFLASALAACPGRLLHYGQATADDGGQTVSYCGMLFEEDAD